LGVGGVDFLCIVSLIITINTFITKDQFELDNDALFINQRFPTSKFIDAVFPSCS
jgi:hypothetical protein